MGLGFVTDFNVFLKVKHRTRSKPLGNFCQGWMHHVKGLKSESITKTSAPAVFTVVAVNTAEFCGLIAAWQDTLRGLPRIWRRRGGSRISPPARHKPWSRDCPLSQGHCLSPNRHPLCRVSLLRWIRSRLRRKMRAKRRFRRRLALVRVSYWFCWFGRISESESYSSSESVVGVV